MKVKLNNIMAGPDGCHQPGTIIDIDAASAKYLIESRQAEAVESDEPAKKEVKAVEVSSSDEIRTTEGTSGSEKAVAPKRRGKVKDVDPEV